MKSGEEGVREPRCEICKDQGFVLCAGEVEPCPNCNPDSGYESGEYQAELTAKLGRCGDPRNGGGRTCYLPMGHKGSHAFMCGR